MMCTNCGQSPASFFFTQSVDGRETSVALCANCAKKAGLAGLGMTSPLFGSFFPANDARRVRRDGGKRCPLCGQTYDDIFAMGKVGCPKCYDTFREELRDTIRSIHGTAKHIGRTPGSADAAAAAEAAMTVPAPEKSEEETLRDELAAAIEAENYEHAAELRDRIKALKGEDHA